MNTTLPPAKRLKERGSRELWLEAAYQALVEGGVDSVRIQVLSDRLNLSRTSFYWFFQTREELLEALLDRWEQTNTRGFIAAAEAYAETPAEAALNLLACFIKGEQFDPRFEFAIRSWALQSDDTMKRVERADEARMEALRSMLRRFGYNESETDVRTQTIYLAQIGYISMQRNESVGTRIRRVPTYVRIYTGTDATASEMARFSAPFGYRIGDDGQPVQVKRGTG
ncbi:TetR/AcrR family transcriptional regulator [Paracoccus chinensis]|uniref:Transcriptional regulator, TetR family n=1 Tax=Paracoccus chinensis TaxID=525640 RepID=A0A1G9MMW5_9RHOB|nr:TetR/AcrR family transcriptional regulator [Paracoccus chinensis]SDL75403.1 transcriptional regulator, TetR family [Paracoccus chinensis]